MEVEVGKAAPICGPSFRSPSGKRMVPRVPVPSQIEIAGATYSLLNLGLGGCALKDSGLSVELGDPVRISIALQVGTMTVVASDVIAKVVRSEAGQATAFQFVELSSDACQLLDRAVEAWLRGSLPKPDSLIPSSRTLPPPLGHQARKRKLDRRLLRTMALLIIGAVGLGTSATFVLSRWLVVHSEFGAVAGPLRLIRAPQNGLITMAGLGVGSGISAGQDIVEVQPVVPPQIHAELEPQIYSAETRLNQLQGELGQAQAGFENFRALAPAQLQAAIAERQTLEREVAAEERVFQRTWQLAQSSFATLQQVDQMEINLTTQRRALAAAIAAEDTARQRLDDASHGRFVSDGKSMQRTPKDIETDIHATKIQMEELKATLHQLTTPTTIKSPCSCVVTQIGATSGSYVSAGDAILGLTEENAASQVEVDALVESTRVGFLKLGQTVDVYLGGSAVPTSGHITQLNYNPENTGRAGLPDNLRSLKSYGLVTVTLDNRPRETAVGLPALLAAPIEPGMWLRNVLGFTGIGGHQAPSPASPAVTKRS